MPFMAAGIVVSACLAVGVAVLEDATRFVASLAGYVFTGGVFLTAVLANRYIGGGKDVDV